LFQTEKIPLKVQILVKTIPRTVLAEHPLKFPYDTYNSPKIVKIFPQI
jgi:hypothetical protein